MITRTCGVYCITNTVNNKKYIGSSVKIEMRWTEHRSCLKYNRHTNYPLQNAYNKYGKASFVYSIVEVCPKELLITREDFYILKFDTLDRAKGYNLELASVPYRSIESNQKRSKTLRGRVVSEETRTRLREALGGKNNPMFGKHHSPEAKGNLSKRFSGENNPNFGKKHSEEIRKIISEKMKGENNWNFGGHHSEETKAKMSKSMTGKKHYGGQPMPEEHRRKIGLASLGRKLSDEAKRKISKTHLGNTYCLGRKLTPEHIEKVRQAILGKPRSEETKEKIRKSHLGKTASEETKAKMRESSLKRWQKKKEQEEQKRQENLRALMGQDASLPPPDQAPIANPTIPLA